MAEPITEDWLKEVGFKWHQLERQPHLHWLLWLGDSLRKSQMFCSTEDLGIEVSSGSDGNWFCWLRSDLSHRYSRFLSLGFVRTRDELVRIIEAISRLEWNPANHLHGSLLTPENAERTRQRDADLDRRVMYSNKWREIEKDESVGGALPEHLEAHQRAKESEATT